jgi:preprotein translocase SecE subunit
VARDRKRAKQRRERRDRLAPADGREADVSTATTGASSPPSEPESAPAPPSPSAAAEEMPASDTRATGLPASGGLPSAFAGGPEEFDAAIARGGAGIFDEQDEQPDATPPETGNGEVVAVETLGDESREDSLDEGETNGAKRGAGESGSAVASAPAVTRGGEVADGRRRRRGAANARAEVHPGRQSLLARTVAFLRASWAELQRMQWPDRRHTSQATAVVLGFVVIAGVYLGVADWVAQKLVNLIL